MKRLTMMLVVTLLLGFAMACEKPGPAEKAGKKADDAVENVKKGESPFHEPGSAEKAGEKIDDALGTKK